MKNTKIKVCKECSQEFGSIRLDQKFCSRKCRNDFNNRIERNKKLPTRFIDNILHNNRRILHELKVNELTKDELMDLEFDFGFITHIKSIKDQIYYGCYEYLYSFEGRGIKIYFDNHLKNQTK